LIDIAEAHSFFGKPA
jgi:hypothetical protein